jgi:uncharacterized membrane protein YdbT with pleckstrin-like domain
MQVKEMCNILDQCIPLIPIFYFMLVYTGETLNFPLVHSPKNLQILLLVPLPVIFIKSTILSQIFSFKYSLSDHRLYIFIFSYYHSQLYPGNICAYFIQYLYPHI